MAPQVLVIDKMHESLSADFEEIGLEIDYKPTIPVEEVPRFVSTGKYVGLILRSKLKVTEELINNSEGLVFIARAGAGVDNVNQEALQRKGITLINAPEGNRDAVGEHCVGMLLSLLHNLKVADHQVRKYIWDREGNRGLELKDKTVGILGFGYMGQSFAEKVRGFQCQVIAYDHNKTGYTSELAKEVSEADFFQQTEILSIHIPLDDHNFKLISKSYLSKFKNLKILVNSSRGEVLVLEGLVDLLREKKLMAAALDVLENEKLDNLSPSQKKLYEELFSMDNVLLTPHVAGWTHESYRRINKVLASKVSGLQIAG